MFNFREELERIKKEKPTSDSQYQAQEILNELLNRLKNMDYSKFESIKTLLFYRWDNQYISVKINKINLLMTIKCTSETAENIFNSLKKIVKDSYPEDIVIHSADSFYMKF